MYNGYPIPIEVFNTVYSFVSRRIEEIREKRCNKCYYAHETILCEIAADISAYMASVNPQFEGFIGGINSITDKGEHQLYFVMDLFCEEHTYIQLDFPKDTPVLCSLRVFNNDEIVDERIFQ